MTTRRAKTSPGRPSRFQSVERLTLWIGAICGIVVAVTGVVDWLSRSDPPRVVWESTMDADGATMSVVPELAKRTSSFTQPFPLAFRLRNIGEQTARDVSLRIVHPPNIAFKEPAGVAAFRQRVPTEGGQIVTTFDVGDLKPDEDVLNQTVEVVAENTLYLKTTARTRDDVAVVISASVALAYRLQATVLGSDLRADDSTFFINVARAREFRKHKRDYLRLDRSGEWRVVGAGG